MRWREVSRWMAGRPWLLTLHVSQHVLHCDSFADVICRAGTLSPLRLQPPHPAGSSHYGRSSQCLFFSLEATYTLGWGRISATTGGCVCAPCGTGLLLHALVEETSSLTSRLDETPYRPLFELLRAPTPLLGDRDHL